MRANPDITVGVVGRPIRASVSPWGDVTGWGAPSADGSQGESRTLSWYIAAAARGHVPSSASTVRQRRLDGTPVVETRIRVPDGDAVHRVWSVADRGGLTIVEIHNDSPLPFAVAFSGAPVLTERPPSAVGVQGIDLPDDAIVLPVGHHASIRVGLSDDPGSGAFATGALLPVADSDAVVRGWLATVDRASRLELPDEGLVEAVAAARCDLLLEGPVDAEVDPADFLVDVGELVRLGDDAVAWLPEIVAPIEAIARRPGPAVASALRAAGRVTRAAGDDRATGDLDRVLRRRGDDDPAPRVVFSALERGTSAGRFVHDAESLLAAGGALLPAGVPTPWLGVDFAVHGLPTGPSSSVSFAVRWHGERPAVLWEQSGPSTVLTSPALDPDWSTSAASGEALWAAPTAPTSLRVTSLPAG